MRFAKIITLTIIFGLIFFNGIDFSTRTLNETDCVNRYIQSGVNEGKIFKVPNGNGYHIEPEPTVSNWEEVGYVKGCTMIYYGNPIISVYSTQNCVFSKILLTNLSF